MQWVIGILLIVIGLPMGIGLIAILTEHQRKMAEIVHKSSANGQVVAQLQDELRKVREEMAEMRDRLNQQVLAVDVNPALTAEKSSAVLEQGSR